MTKENFLTHMALLYKYFSVSPDSDKTNLFWQLLKHMSDDEFKVAVTGVMREFIPTSANPFPLVSHFLKFSGSDAQGMAVKAVSTLKACIRSIGKYESLRFDDPTLMLLVDRFGGWPTICTWGDTDWNVNEGRLIESYKTFSQSGLQSDIDHLPGISEKDAGFFRIYNIESNTARRLSYQRLSGVQILETVNLVKIDSKNTKQIGN